MKDKLYQIGLPIECLSTVLMNWTCFEPMERVLFSPSSKTKGWVVIETRHEEFASAVVRDVSQAKVKILDQQVKRIDL